MPGAVDLLKTEDMTTIKDRLKVGISYDRERSFGASGALIFLHNGPKNADKKYAVINRMSQKQFSGRIMKNSRGSYGTNWFFNGRTQAY